MNDPIRHAPADTRRLGFQIFGGAPTRGSSLGCATAQRWRSAPATKGAGYYVTAGKRRACSTGSLFICAGLDGVETVRRDGREPQVAIVSDRHGGAGAAYRVARKLAADSSGHREKTAA